MFAQAGTHGGALTVTRDTSLPSAVNASFSYKVAVTTANASPTAGQNSEVQTRIEGFNFLPLKDKTITLSFWVKSNLTGTFCVAFRNGAANRSLVKEYTINVANTWEQKTITITHDSTGTWNYTTGVGLIVDFVLMSGSTFITTADTWQAGNFLATSAHTNVLASTSNDFFLSQIQFEEGAAANAFEFVDFERALNLCKRYYEKSVAHNVYAFTGDTTAVFGLFGTTAFPTPVARYMVEKRATPVAAVFATTSGTASAVRNRTAAADVTGVTVNNSLMGHTVTKTAGFIAANFYSWNWTANAEM
jgi:hypothetical protein